MDINLSKLWDIVKDREPGMLQSVVSPRVRHDWATKQPQQPHRVLQLPLLFLHSPHPVVPKPNHVLHTLICTLPLECGNLCGFSPVNGQPSFPSQIPLVLAWLGFAPYSSFQLEEDFSEKPSPNIPSRLIGKMGTPVLTSILKLNMLYYNCLLNLPSLFTVNCETKKQVTAAAAKSPQSCPTLCNPRDGSPPGSPVPGILQARTLEWVPLPSPKKQVSVLLIIIILVWCQAYFFALNK